MRDSPSLGRVANVGRTVDCIEKIASASERKQTQQGGGSLSGDKARWELVNLEPPLWHNIGGVNHIIRNRNKTVMFVPFRGALYAPGQPDAALREV